MKVVIISYLHRVQREMGEDSVGNFFGGEGGTSSAIKRASNSQNIGTFQNFCWFDFFGIERIFLFLG